MKYMLLIYSDPSLFEGEQSRELRCEMIAKHMRLQEDLRAAGVAYSGRQLQPATVATTVRAGGGAQTLHDAPDLDAAIAWARRIPTAEKGAVEVRPVVER